MIFAIFFPLSEVSQSLNPKVRFVPEPFARLDDVVVFAVVHVVPNDLLIAIRDRDNGTFLNSLFLGQHCVFTYVKSHATNLFMTLRRPIEVVAGVYILESLLIFSPPCL